PHEVAMVLRSSALLVWRTVDLGSVGVGERAGAEALDARVLVEGSAAAHRVAQAVGEGPDPRAAELALRRLLEPRVVRDLPEVPPLAVEVHALAVHAVALGRQRVERFANGRHVLDRVVAHE